MRVTHPGGRRRLPAPPRRETGQIRRQTISRRGDIYLVGDEQWAATRETATRLTKLTRLTRLRTRTDGGADKTAVEVAGREHDREKATVKEKRPSETWRCAKRKGAQSHRSSRPVFPKKTTTSLGRSSPPVSTLSNFMNMYARPRRAAPRRRVSRYMAGLTSCERPAADGGGEMIADFKP